MRQPILMLFALSLTSTAAAADFKMMKSGEWAIEVLESSLGPATSAMKPKPFCIDPKDGNKDLETVMRDELKKTKMDCELKLLKKEVNAVSYDVACTANEASTDKNAALPAGAKVEGTMTMTRETDSSYTLDQDTKATGLKVPNIDTSKIPAEQKKLLEGVLAMQGGNLKFKMKQRYTHIRDTCAKNVKAKT